MSWLNVQNKEGKKLFILWRIFWHSQWDKSWKRTGKSVFVSGVYLNLCGSIPVIWGVTFIQNENDFYFFFKWEERISFDVSTLLDLLTILFPFNFLFNYGKIQVIKELSCCCYCFLGDKSTESNPSTWFQKSCFFLAKSLQFLVKFASTLLRRTGQKMSVNLRWIISVSHYEITSSP